MYIKTDEGPLVRNSLSVDASLKWPEVPRALWKSYGGGLFLISEVPLYLRRSFSRVLYGFMRGSSKYRLQGSLNRTRPPPPPRTAMRTYAWSFCRALRGGAFL